MKRIELHELQEMDIVLREDGHICWVLQNSFTNKYQTFSLSMWGQHELSDYNQDFTYGNGVNYFIKERDSKYNIVGVCRPMSKWHAIKLVRDYEMAVDRYDETDEESVLDLKKALDAFKWEYVNDAEYVLTLNISYSTNVQTFIFHNLKDLIEFGQKKYDDIGNMLNDAVANGDTEIAEQMFDKEQGTGIIRFKNFRGLNTITFGVERVKK